MVATPPPGAVTLHEYIIKGEGVASIGSGAFFRCINLADIVLPANLVEIETMRFTTAVICGDAHFSRTAAEMYRRLFSALRQCFPELQKVDQASIPPHSDIAATLQVGLPQHPAVHIPQIPGGALRRSQQTSATDSWTTISSRVSSSTSRWRPEQLGLTWGSWR